MLFDHEIEDCPTLIARLHNKGALQPPLTQNLQMMRFEPCEEDPNVHIVLQSELMIEDDKGKKPEESTWVSKAPTKEPKVDLERVKETFMEAKKSFTDAFTLGSKDRLELEMDPSMLTTFLETCMKLLRERKDVKRLEELITRCAGTLPGEPFIVYKLKKYTMRTRSEMRLTVQIGEYEMDQLILVLGSDANVLPQRTWECMGRPTLQCSPIQL